MSELLQSYNEQGLPINGKGVSRGDAFSQNLLHAASHVWIWRVKGGVPEVLLQKRSATMITWPNCYDISAAGHIGFGEAPLYAAMREAKEEINLDIAENDLRLFSAVRAQLIAPSGAKENEFQWLYSLKCPDNIDFNLQESEVASLLWIPLEQFKAECMSDQYVPHGKVYYDTVIEALESAARA
jgi:isopentenyl-diphosphate Delta-isomerase